MSGLIDWFYDRINRPALSTGLLTRSAASPGPWFRNHGFGTLLLFFDSAVNKSAAWILPTARYSVYSQSQIIWFMIISGKDLSTSLKAEMARQVATFPEKYGRVPHLVVILVGNDPGSQTYVKNKAKACDVVGIKNTTIRLPEETPEAELLGKIAELNADDSVDGILVQLPLPKQISEPKVIEAIAQEKDVDGFHPLNTAALWQKRPNTNYTVPCTPKGIIKLLEAAGCEISGKNAVVIGRSQIVGLPIAKLLLDRNATVTICHSKTRNLLEISRQADILVVAIGRPKFVTGDMVKVGAAVIDVGMDRDENGNLCGDVDFESVEPKASVITPVPGGVGPMTICCLMENTIECFLRRVKV